MVQIRKHGHWRLFAALKVQSNHSRQKEVETAKNMRKREVAVTQLLTHIRDVIGTTMPTIKSVVIGGDFNTKHDQAMFSAEKTLDSLADAGYQNGFEGLTLAQRVTHPGTHGFPDATFDFIFAKGLTASQPTVIRTNVSDHLPVTRSFRLRWCTRVSLRKAKSFCWNRVCSSR